MDPISMLTNDHREVEKLFGRWEGLSAGKEDERREVAQEIVRHLATHAAIEEQLLYPTVRDRVPGGEALARESLEEHQQVERVLDELDSADATDPGYAEKLGQLMRDVDEHVREEENEIFPKLRDAVPQDDLDSIGEAMEKARKVAPTRPHPAAPDSPPGNLVAGPVAGAVDRVRDAIREIRE